MGTSEKRGIDRHIFRLIENKSKSLARFASRVDMIIKYLTNRLLESGTAQDGETFYL